MNLLHRLDPVAFARDRLAFDPAPYQAAVMRARAARSIRVWARQTGKSTTAAAEAVHEAVARPGSLVLVVSPSQRQSGETHRKILDFLDRLDDRGDVVDEESRTTMTATNGSRIVALPDSPDTIRGYSGPDFVILDEASRLSDAAYQATRPMLAHGGRLALLSTPAGRRGFFAREWFDGGERWRRSEMRAEDSGLIDPGFLEEERQALGPRMFDQEYGCAFNADGDALFDRDTLEGLIDGSVRPLFGPRGEVDLGPPPSAERLAALVNSAGGAA